MERSLWKYRRIISLLPSKLGGGMASPGIAGNLFQPLPLMAASGIVILVVAVGYFFWQKPSPSSTSISEEITSSPPATHSRQSLPSISEGQEAETIRSLFENIKQANLQKDIDLFMSCYSSDFKDRKGKRVSTLENWENLNYLNLTYDLKKQTISGNTANVRVEWLIRISQKSDGQPQDSKSVLDVTLRREEGSWKIKEIKSVS